MSEFATQSRQLTESGYLEWLCSQLSKQAQDQFGAAAPEDCAALTRARIAYDLVAQVRQIVRTNAKLT